MGTSPVDLTRRHGVEDLGHAVVGQRGVERPADPERVLGVPPVDVGLLGAPPLPETGGAGRPEGPRRSGRITVERVQQRGGRAAEPLHQLGLLLRRVVRTVVAAALGHRGRRPDVATAEMHGEVA
jgi:hypothetical protein